MTKSRTDSISLLEGQVELTTRRATGSFPCFVELMWPVLEPDTPFGTELAGKLAPRRFARWRPGRA